MWYVLNASNEPVPESDPLKAAEFFSDFARRVVAQHEIGESFVSTVFLAIDHSFGNGDPVLFETLVQGGPLDDHMERYTTWSDAVSGHYGVLRTLAEPLGKPFTEVARPVPLEERPPRDYPTIFDRLLEDE